MSFSALAEDIADADTVVEEGQKSEESSEEKQELEENDLESESRKEPEAGEATETGESISGPVTAVDENGNVYEIPDEVGIVENPYSMFRTISPKVVNFNTKGARTTSYVEVDTGYEGYTCGLYGADAVYLGESGNKIKFMLSGVIGLVDASEVQVVDLQAAQSISHYEVKNGRLIHKITVNIGQANYASSLDNGAAPSYLQSGINYYSYDGHYFYTDFATMANDYIDHTRDHAVNAPSPYFNYFQYLPFRSQTNYGVDALNTMLNSQVSATSKMRDIAAVLIEKQNKYGTNALLMAGVAANESAWGNSSIAQSKNNLFGLNAVDSSPGQSANYYANVETCIKDYSETYMSKQYLNPNNWKYFGGFLGNKASGINVKYASDPYWGEKAAALAYRLDQNSGNKDVNKYTIGVKDALANEHENINIRSGNSTSTTRLYTTGRQSSHTFLVLDSTPSNNFYKIQSDGALNNNRTGLSTSGEYNFSNMYAYISADYLHIILKGNGSTTDIPDTSEGNDHIRYQAHCQDYGWLPEVADGGTAGTTQQEKRMEAMKIYLEGQSETGSIEYMVHSQDYGWLDWVANGAIAGTVGESKRAEAIKIRLTGKMAQKYDVYYRVHSQDYGWLGWTKNGEAAGTEGLAKRMEAFEVRLVKKGGAAPGSTNQAYIVNRTSIKYRVFAKSYGWQNAVRDGEISGTEGLSTSMEAIEISLENQAYAGGIKYRAHCQDYGWFPWVENGEEAGITTRGKRMEAIQIVLTGEMAQYYDVYYRVHSQDYGWLDWAKNGQSAGTSGLAKRGEAIQIKIIKKGAEAPGSTTCPYVE